MEKNWSEGVGHITELVRESFGEFISTIFLFLYCVTFVFRPFYLENNKKSSNLESKNIPPSTTVRE